MAIWVIKDGQREGPYEEQDVRELIYEGTYTEADSAIRDGQFDWSTLGQLLDRQQPRSEPGLPEPSPVSAEEFPSPPLDIPADPLSEPALAQPEPPPLPAARDGLPAYAPRPIAVTVTDVRMPFGSMVFFMVKWVIASIPALIILAAIAAILSGLFISIVAVIATLLRH
jgi:hypothetical protein